MVVVFVMPPLVADMVTVKVSVPHGTTQKLVTGEAMVAGGDALSVTTTLNEYVPTWVGVPSTTPDCW